MGPPSLAGATREPTVKIARGHATRMLAIAGAALAGCLDDPASYPRLAPSATGASAGVERLPALAGWRRWAIDRSLDLRVWTGARAGFVAAVSIDDRVVHAGAYGVADIETGEPMTLDTRFHVASMTKPVTAAAALILVERGRLGLEDEVSRYLPDFADLRVHVGRDASGRFVTRAPTRPLRVRHLLEFRAGLGGYDEGGDPLARHWRSPDIEAPGLGALADRVALVPRLPLYEDPGEVWRYGWSADVLARVVEVAAGVPFATFLEREIFAPLGMHATSYPDAVPSEGTIARMVTHDATGALTPERRFDASYGRGWSSGGGGLVSTAVDYLRFAAMLAGGGRLGEVRLLSEESVANMLRLHVPDGVLTDQGLEGFGWGLGLSVVAEAARTPMVADADGDAWWSGRFGTQFWIRPSTRTALVVMQQTERSEGSDLPIGPAIVQALALP